MRVSPRKYIGFNQNYSGYFIEANNQKLTKEKLNVTQKQLGATLNTNCFMSAKFDSMRC